MFLIIRAELGDNRIQYMPRMKLDRIEQTAVDKRAHLFVRHG